MALVIAWAVVLVLLLRRHAAAVRTDPAARGVFRNASIFQTIYPVLPGLLLWGWPGWIAGAIGLCCMVAVLTRRRPSR